MNARQPNKQFRRLCSKKSKIQYLAPSLTETCYSRSNRKKAEAEWNWDFFFDNWGVKTVTANDIAKLAYVPNAEQRQALNAAGFLPAPDSNLHN